MCQELGILLGAQNSGPAHYPLGFKKARLEIPCVPGHKDCRLIRERGKGIWRREDRCESVLQLRNDSWGTPSDKATVPIGLSKGTETWQFGGKRPEDLYGSD